MWVAGGYPCCLRGRGRASAVGGVGCLLTLYLVLTTTDTFTTYKGGDGITSASVIRGARENNSTTSSTKGTNGSVVSNTKGTNGSIVSNTNSTKGSIVSKTNSTNGSMVSNTGSTMSSTKGTVGGDISNKGGWRLFVGEGRLLCVLR